jgi:hypothetical protein
MCRALTGGMRTERWQLSGLPFFVKICYYRENGKDGGDLQTIGIRGDLIRWARSQQQLSTRYVRDRRGPSLGYQSEVENGKKSEVRSSVLARWIDVLNITEAFARGQIPPYSQDPSACRGLAGDVGELVKLGSPTAILWLELDTCDRVIQLLRLITRESRNLPRVVLAYVLGLELASLDALLLAKLPVTQQHLQITAHLTTLPPLFLLSGQRDDAAVLEGRARIGEELRASVS